MTFVDGFLAAVPVANKAAYLEQAKMMSGMMKELGALSVMECWGVDVPEGKKTSMHLAVAREEGEGIVLSFVTWPSKEVRDAAWAKMEADERMQGMSMPFDGSRLIHGGFEAMLEA
ncbi:MAG: DUF1428 domain-containing protein [Hyphomonas sp.]|uniref:DUF1428 domain-containing protein n=1 Tax=Hyphomonas atlantica TaxID=1280948 RepID=A0A059EBQ8_9PROT|nr:MULTISPECIES: DUF1428 domain-containing protein [Hyphomonas]KCZ64942.1 hypothetical protein HY36_00805 [Hyphomonas atlantica]MAH91922.1 DUF1428 domain-containing protein [Hyphomonas sp.]OUX89208.1 MAG: RNA signal recognition particle [Hyphomonas sp. TMED31]|tara:strand:+ start:16 stop:363 length:348 start_codon:yes stop_codon:yes gene_type:complete